MKKIFTLLFSIAATSVFAQSYSTNNLVAFLPFNGNVIDSMKYAVLDANGSSLFTTDRDGNTDRAIDVPSVFNGGHFALTQNEQNLKLNTEFTISMWVKLPADINTYPSNAFPIALSIGNNLNLGFERVGNDLRAVATVISPGNNLMQISDFKNITPSGQWIHLVFKRGGSFYEIFAHEQNTAIGDFIQTQQPHSNSNPTYSSIAQVTFGYQGTNVLRELKGAIDDVFLYSRALSYSEIYDLHNLPTSNHVPVCASLNAPTITTPMNELTICTGNLISISADYPVGSYTRWKNDLGNFSVVTNPSNPNAGFERFEQNPIIDNCLEITYVLAGCISSSTSVCYNVIENANINSITFTGETDNIMNQSIDLCEGTVVDFNFDIIGDTVLLYDYDFVNNIKVPINLPYTVTQDITLYAEASNTAGCNSNSVFLNISSLPSPDATITFDSTSGRIIASVTDADFYAWFDCDEDTLVFSSTSQNYFEPTITGSYYVEITKDDCSAISLDCIDFLAEGDTVVDPNSVNNSFEYNINIYPNPAKEIVNIQKAPKGSVLTIADITGKIIYTSVIVNHTEMINTNTISSGVYVIRVENNTDFMIEKLIVKN